MRRSYFASQPTAHPITPLNNPVPPTGSPTPGINGTPNPSISQRSTPLRTVQRTHTVAAGETLAAIARQQGVSLTALQAANPGVNPKKMRMGQVINLPAP